MGLSASLSLKLKAAPSPGDSCKRSCFVVIHMPLGDKVREGVAQNTVYHHEIGGLVVTRIAVAVVSG